MASVFYQCLTTVASAIDTLALAGTPTIKTRKLPLDRDAAKPGVFIYPVPERFNLGVTDARDDIGYGVQVALVQTSNQDLTGDFDRLLLWRETIRKAFSQDQGVTRLAGIVNGDGNRIIYQVEPEPGMIVDPALFRAQYDVSGLTIRCWAREFRT